MNGQVIGKSKIQLMIESNARVYQLKNMVREFVEKYDTDNKIFGLSDGTPLELEKGYMEIESTYENLEDALDHINQENQCIQILGREKVGRTYRVGTVKQLSECKINDFTVVDINKLREI